MVYKSLTTLVLIAVITLWGGSYASAVTDDDLSHSQSSHILTPHQATTLATALANGPDLIIGAITWSPEKPLAGDRVTFTITVRNQGTQSAGPSSIDCYIDDTPVASLPVDTVSAGASLNVTFTWKAQPDSHTVKAIANSTGNIIESDETNNALMFAFSVLAPDLVVDNITWSPENPQIGDKVTFTVTTRNQGSSQSAYTYTDFYVNGSSRGYQGVQRLDAGATALNTFLWIAQAGSHELEARADVLNQIVESDESNNIETVTYSTLVPDLVIKEITWSSKITAESDNVTLTVTIGNDGQGKSNPSRAAFYVDDIHVATAQVRSLAAGATAATTYIWQFQAGSHTFRAEADSSQENTESDETNNTKTVSLPTRSPDLIVAGIIWSPLNPKEAHYVTFTVTIKNQGYYVANLSQIYFYIDSVPYYGWISRLEPGAEVNMIFPWVAQLGSHTFRAVADATNLVAEINESNNEKTVTLAGSQPSPIDLVIQNIAWSPESPAVGDELTFTATVRNQGTGQTGWFGVAFYIDDNSLASSSLSPLAAGATTTTTFSWQAQPGAHTIKVMADPDKVLTETDESNNIKTNTFSVLASDIFIKEYTWSPASPSPGETVAFTLTLSNQGNDKAGHSYVGYFANESPRGSHYVEELEVGATVTKTFTVIFEANLNTIKIVSDMNNEVSELDENNNEKRITFPIPDLAVAAITWAPQKPAENENIVFRVSLRNQGSGTAPSADINFYIDGSSQSHRVVAAIEAGATVTETFTWIAQPGSHAIKVVINKANNITESDDTNNEKTVTVSVSPTQDTPISPPAAQPTPAPATGLQTQEPGVHLYSQKDKVAVGQDIVLYLSAANPADNPTMAVELVLEVPPVMSVTSPGLKKSDDGNYTATYLIAPGAAPQIDVRLRADQAGNYLITGQLTYYFAGDKSTATTQAVSLPVTVSAAPTQGVKLSTAGSPQKEIWLAWWPVIAAAVVCSLGVILVFILKLRRKSQ